MPVTQTEGLSLHPFLTLFLTQSQKKAPTMMSATFQGLQLLTDPVIRHPSFLTDKWCF